MAVTGQTGTQAPQSMHSVGLMYSCFSFSNCGSSLRGWMQSTGQTSTHAESLVPMQGSAITKALQNLLYSNGGPAPHYGLRDERNFLIPRPCQGRQAA